MVCSINVAGATLTKIIINASLASYKLTRKNRRVFDSVRELQL